MRILIVEDYLRLLRLYEKVLTVAGHEVHKAASLTEAYDRLTAETFDVCLLDVKLGFNSGIDLLETLPEGIDVSQTRFIVVSGWDQYREVCRAAEIDFYLKPISNKELVDIVAEDETQREALRALHE